MSGTDRKKKVHLTETEYDGIMKEIRSSIQGEKSYDNEENGR